MDDRLLELEAQAEAIAEDEYRRGKLLLAKANSIGGEHFDIVKVDCPWCGEKRGYVFDLLTSWSCEKCGYYPSADLFGGQYS